MKLWLETQGQDIVPRPLHAMPKGSDWNCYHLALYKAKTWFVTLGHREFLKLRKVSKFCFNGLLLVWGPLILMLISLIMSRSWRNLQIGILIWKQKRQKVAAQLQKITWEIKGFWTVVISRLRFSGGFSQNARHSFPNSCTFYIVTLSFSPYHSSSRRVTL